MKGVASFEDLGINLRGTGYVLEFESSMGIFTTTLTVDVDYSAEYQVRVKLLFATVPLRMLC